MNRKHLSILFSILFAAVPYRFIMNQKNVPEQKKETNEWILSKLTSNNTKGANIAGNPGILKCKYGDAVSFDGSSDGIFLDSLPLANMEQFTVEIIFQPQSGGSFAQRFLHIGEIQGNRILLELRSVKSGWYLDGFVKSGPNSCTLIDSLKLHPSDKWYHVACTLDKGKFTTYINGKKEKEGNIDFTPLKTGKTSVGVRQNKTSWFKGCIYEIKISGKALKPSGFIKL